MAERGKTDQIGVYIDFDNVVISRYDEVHGERAFHNEIRNSAELSPQALERLTAAHVDIGAIVEYAASFGTVAISRAYADWSAPVNAAYRKDFVETSIDLVQMFPLSGTKNGADIRLAIDVIDDLARYDYVNHVLVVAGDSDYVSLAQRCKRLGRTVIGVGVANSVGRYWKSACDVFKMYETLPGVTPPVTAPQKKATATKKATPAKKGTQRKAAVAAEPASLTLLRKAMSLQSEKSEDGWVTAAALKSLMRRLEASFDEKADGYKSFTAFLEGHPELVDTRNIDQVLSARLKA